MFGSYRKLSAEYKPLPLAEERKLIRLAKKGNDPARNKLLLHLTGFFIFRIETTLFSSAKREFGEDILQECILFAQTKIKRYNLRYKDKNGVFKKVYLRTYLWKGITGLMFSYIKKYEKECQEIKPWED
jgi:hypothetical protein